MKRIIFAAVLLLVCLVGCSSQNEVSAGKADKAALEALLADFENIPKTLDQDTLVSAYTRIFQREDASQKEVNQAVSGLIELKNTIFSTPMSFVDGGVEPHVRAELKKDVGTVITIGDCYTLKHLDCTYDPDLGSQIRVAYDFRYFPNLQYLDLSGNALEDLNGFAYLSDLEVLVLDDNPARSSSLDEEDAEAEVRSFDVLGNLPIKELSLSGEGVLPSLSVLPVIPTLATLNISGNHLKNLDGIGGRFPHLEILYAADCSLEQLSSLSECSEILYLDLSRSKISDLSGVVGLGSLETLVLDGVLIDDFSPLMRLSGLSTLSLKSCGISDISWITSLSELEVLDLSKNNITECSFSEGMTAVVHLDLNGNKITSFVLSDALSDISYLNLNGNLLTTFTVETSNGDCNLDTLHLANNALTSVSLGKSSNLKAVHLGNNALTAFSLQSESLVSLDLSANPLTALHLSLPNLSYLTLDCASVFDTIVLNLPKITHLQMAEPIGASVDFLASLTTLNSLVINVSLENAPSVPSLPELTELTVIGISDEEFAGMPLLPKLQHLTVEDSPVVIPSFRNDLSIVSVAFRGCAQLADLSGLSAVATLESVSVVGGNLPSPQVSALQNLKTLALNECGVVDLALVSGLPALESLSLSGNGLESITVLGFAQLKNLDLSNNNIASSEGLVLDLARGTLNLAGNSETLYESLPTLSADVVLILSMEEE